MHADFKDITSVMGTPDWYDVHGFPRYGKFKPDNTSNIYADVVIYYHIACQSCGKPFYVAFSLSIYNLYEYGGFKQYIKDKGIGPNVALRNHIIPYFKSMTPEGLSNAIHYGDPPRHDCVGDTMNCDDIRIEQFWFRDRVSD